MLMHMHVGISLLNIPIGTKCQRCVSACMCAAGSRDESRYVKPHLRKPGSHLFCYRSGK